MKDFLGNLLTKFINMFISLNSGALDADLVDMLNDPIPTDGVVGTIWDLCLAIAYGMTAIYFVYECNNKWAFEGNDISAKSFVAPFLKAIVAVIVIGNSQKVFFGMYDITAGWVNKLNGESADPVDLGVLTSTDPGAEVVKAMGILQLIVILLPALLGWVIGCIVNLVFKFKVILYRIEFAFRIGISPLALADSFNGLSSNSLRWLKGFFGICIYGAAFVAVPKIGAALFSSTVLTDLQSALTGAADDPFEIFSYAFQLIILPIAELGVLGSIQQACKEAAS